MRSISRINVIPLLTLTYILWEVTCMLNHIRKLSTLFAAASLLNARERRGVKPTLTMRALCSLLMSS
ncbi:hypothetical protein PUN28_006191 [Cardiocondyla obscurior]|uniref:Secreted protein n=1 Tax=Cardiocondyla obscurior TaxID=286306 RepID=A0AAW2GDN9_9HYME